MLFGQRGQPAPVPVVQVAGGNPAWDTTNRHCQETKCYLRNQDTSTHNYSTLFFARNMSRFSYYFRYTADSSYYYFSIIIDSLCQANFILICSKFDQKCIL